MDSSDAASDDEIRRTTPRVDDDDDDRPEAPPPRAPRYVLGGMCAKQRPRGRRRAEATVRANLMVFLAIVFCNVGEGGPRARPAGAG